ncbi:MAG TPA: enoyl-CoA hydratase-related protein [Balneolaceae bacterium]|nr:enoyl-CoA hydratase-related protein [Balneolaceae bacterium]
MSQPALNHLLLDEKENGIIVVTINRPDKLNALNGELLEELRSAFTYIEERSQIKATILTGSGDKAFVAGADIKELRELNRQTGEKLSSNGQQIFSFIEQSSKPVIALINGYALGGGAELAMACHIRIATENALIGLPEVSLGLIPGYGGTQRLPSLVGISKAMEMILTGSPVNAEEAEQFGLVSSIHSSETVMEEAVNLAEKIIKNGPLAVHKAMQAVLASRPDHGFTKEAVLFGQLCETEDFKEGTSAFLEKRKAEFKNR